MNDKDTVVVPGRIEFVSKLSAALLTAYKANGGIAAIARRAHGAALIRNIATLEAAKVFADLAAAPSTSVREESARELLTLLVLYDDEAQPRGLQDAVDNTGAAYQSAAMAGLVTAARMLLDPIKLAAQIAEHREALAALKPSTDKGGVE